MPYLRLCLLVLCTSFCQQAELSTPATPQIDHPSFSEVPSNPYHFPSLRPEAEPSFQKDLIGSVKPNTSTDAGADIYSEIPVGSPRSVTSTDYSTHTPSSNPSFHSRQLLASSTIVISISSSNFNNISTTGGEQSIFSCIISSSNPALSLTLASCNFTNCTSEAKHGQILALSSAESVIINSCSFFAQQVEQSFSVQNACYFNGSILSFRETEVNITTSQISGASEGALSLSGCDTVLSNVLFTDNSPLFERYPSIQRNIMCSPGYPNDGRIQIIDPTIRDFVNSTSFWIYNSGCTITYGTTYEITSPFFVPKLTNVSTAKIDDKYNITFKGNLLLPCDLRFSLFSKKQSNALDQEFEFSDFIDEHTAMGRVNASIIDGVAVGEAVFIRLKYPGSSEDESNTLTLQEAKAEENLTQSGQPTDQNSMIIIIALGAACGLFLLVVVVQCVVIGKQKTILKREQRRADQRVAAVDVDMDATVEMEGPQEKESRKLERDEVSLPTVYVGCNDQIIHQQVRPLTTSSISSGAFFPTTQFVQPTPTIVQTFSPAQMLAQNPNLSLSVEPPSYAKDTGYSPAPAPAPVAIPVPAPAPVPVAVTVHAQPPAASFVPAEEFVAIEHSEKKKKKKKKAHAGAELASDETGAQNKKVELSDENVASLVSFLDDFPTGSQDEPLPDPFPSSSSLKPLLNDELDAPKKKDKKKKKKKRAGAAELPDDLA